MEVIVWQRDDVPCLFLCNPRALNEEIFETEWSPVLFDIFETHQVTVNNKEISLITGSDALLETFSQKCKLIGLMKKSKKACIKLPAAGVIGAGQCFSFTAKTLEKKILMISRELSKAKLTLSRKIYKHIKNNPEPIVGDAPTKIQSPESERDDLLVYSMMERKIGSCWSEEDSEESDFEDFIGADPDMEDFIKQIQLFDREL